VPSRPSSVTVHRANVGVPRFRSGEPVGVLPYANRHLFPRRRVVTKKQLIETCSCCSLREPVAKFFLASVRLRVCLPCLLRLKNAADPAAIVYANQRPDDGAQSMFPQ
jgi:hypothetical protein